MINARWNGESAWARKVVVIIGTSIRPTWWCADLKGQRRNAVEVIYEGQKFYLDDEGNGDNLQPGCGWRKVTVGLGSPNYGHNSLPDDSEVVEVIWEPEDYPK